MPQLRMPPFPLRAPWRPCAAPEAGPGAIGTTPGPAVDFLAVSFGDEGPWRGLLRQVIEPACRHCEQQCGWKTGVLRHDNTVENLYYAGAVNALVARSAAEFVVYLCGAGHVRAADPSWPSDLIRPMLDDARVAMTGTVLPCHGVLADLGLPPGDGTHVQGGVFAARRQALLRCPYSTDARCRHWGSDVYVSWLLKESGYRLADVPQVKSVWREPVPPGRYKITHSSVRRP